MRAFSLFRSRIWGLASIAISGVCLGGLWLSSGSVLWSVSALAQEPANERKEPSAAFSAARVSGHDNCVDCHRTEYAAWRESAHSAKVYDRLRVSKTSLEYAEKLDIRPADIARNSKCVSCHGTPVIDSRGRHGALAGVSCESCHNSAGGEQGWLNRHGVYGPPGTRREDETQEHRKQRVQFCKQAGQLRSDALYDLVKRCFECHVVGDEELIDAGHRTGDNFEFFTYMQGEARHNFILDKRANAEVSTLWLDHSPNHTTQGRKRVMLLLGQMVDIEVSLKNLANASEENELTDAMFDRLETAFELLGEGVIEELGWDDEDEYPDMAYIYNAVSEAVEKYDDDGFEPEDKMFYLERAEKIAEIARRFSQRDGSELREVDELDDLNDLMEEDALKGKPFTP